MRGRFTKSTVEEAARAWLESLDQAVKHGPDIAPDTPALERRNHYRVVLAQRLRDAAAQLNPDPPAEALDNAPRKLTRSEGAGVIQRNRALHRRLADHRWKLASEPDFSRRNPAADRAAHPDIMPVRPGSYRPGSHTLNLKQGPKRIASG
jgi:hypothetical protein